MLPNGQNVDKFVSETAERHIETISNIIDAQGVSYSGAVTHLLRKFKASDSVIIQQTEQNDDALFEQTLSAFKLKQLKAMLRSAKKNL